MEPNSEAVSVDGSPVTRMDSNREATSVHDRIPLEQGNTAKCSCSASASGRNLVVCIDGTSNQFSERNTNVVELYSRLIKNKGQLTYYNSGIGTYVKHSGSWTSWFNRRSWAQWFNNMIDIAIAWNFKSQVLNAYEWLSENYENGDRIFLFGFSRGAYQIRVIAGMIELVGLLHKGNKQQIPFAYELYTESTSNQKRNEQMGRESKRLCDHFKATLSWEHVKVHFVGAWDTVSSIGLFRGRGFPETTTGMGHVCAFRHALAINECRVKFLPEYANGGAGPGKNPKNIKEVWFAGFHSDIGGGNATNAENNLFGPALRWMTYEAIQYKLAMKTHKGGWAPIEQKDSMNIFWRLLECIPILVPRLSYLNENSVERCPPHRAQPRSVQEGQLIHRSALKELLTEYERASFYSKDIHWTEESLEKHGMIEQDRYADVEALLPNIPHCEPEDLDVLHALASTETGPISISQFPGAVIILCAAFFNECTQLYCEDNPAKSGVPKVCDALRFLPLAFQTELKLQIIMSALAVRPPLSVNATSHINEFLSLFVPDINVKLMRVNLHRDDASLYSVTRLADEWTGNSLVPALFSETADILVGQVGNMVVVRHLMGIMKGRSTISVEQLTSTVMECARETHFTLYDPDHLPNVVNGIAHFKYFLERENEVDTLKDMFTLEMYRMKGQYPHRQPDMQIGNMVKDGEAQFPMEPNSKYGLKIRNMSREEVFPYLFWFDTDEYIIRSLYAPPGADVEAPLVAQGELAIGMCAEPAFSFSTSSGDAASGFFKLFVATEYIDLAWIEQTLSPFDAKFEGVSRGRLNIEREDIPMWDAVTVFLKMTVH